MLISVTTSELSGQDDYFFRVSPATRDFVKTSADYYFHGRGLRNLRLIYDLCVYAFNVTNILLDAQEKKHPDQSLKQMLLAQKTFAGVQNPVSFDANGDTQSKTYLFIVKDSMFVPAHSTPCVPCYLPGSLQMPAKRFPLPSKKLFVTLAALLAAITGGIVRGGMFGWLGPYVMAEKNRRPFGSEPLNVTPLQSRLSQRILVPIPGCTEPHSNRKPLRNPHENPAHHDSRRPS